MLLHFLLQAHPYHEHCECEPLAHNSITVPTLSPDPPRVSVFTMSAQLPASLKPADVARFTLRAHQLEQAKPVIAYWANYWVAQQILQKSLHSVDEEALTYTTNLMDKLEKVGTR